MTLIQNGSTPTITFLMVATSDHIAGLTGITPTVNISKAGDAGAASTNAASAVDATNLPGVYKVALTATETNTNGELTFHATGTGGDPSDWKEQVVAFNPTDSVRLGLTALPNATAGANGGLPLGDASSRVDVGRISGTAQTARDIGASVLLSAGSGAGQLDFTSGVVKANLAQILGTALTETAGQIAAAFKKVFDVASPVFTALSVNQTGDNFARIGAPVGASISADVAAVKTQTASIQADTDDIQTRIPAALVSGRMDSSVGAMAANVLTATAIATDAITAAKIAADAIGASELAADAVTEIAAGVSVGSAPTAAQNAAAVWDLAISGHTTSGTFGAKVNGLSGASGSGAIAHTFTVTAPGAIDGALVWVTTDAAGTNTIASAVTDALGHATVFLDAGTYYAWAQRGGINFIEGGSFVVA